MKKEKSYYKKLKAQKEILKSKGWEEVLVEDEDGKKRRRWKNPEHHGYFSVNSACKFIASESSSSAEIVKIKNVVNSVIDVVEDLKRENEMLKEELYSLKRSYRATAPSEA